MTAVSGSAQSRYAHGVGPEPHSYVSLTPGDAILVGTPEGDVDAVITRADPEGARVEWESITGQLSGTADMALPRTEYDMEAGA